MITVEQELKCPRKYCTDRGKRDRPIRVFIAIFFIFYKYIGDCRIYAAVQSPTIKQS
jgi:hypothetical protein